MKYFQENNSLAKYTRGDLEELGFAELESKGAAGPYADFLMKGKDDVIYRFGREGAVYRFLYMRNVPKRDDPSKQTVRRIKPKVFEQWLNKK
jgi:hypothetical protein